MNLYTIEYTRNGMAHSEVRTEPVARAFADFLLRVYRITATVTKIGR